VTALSAQLPREAPLQASLPADQVEASTASLPAGQAKMSLEASPLADQALASLPAGRASLPVDQLAPQVEVPAGQMAADLA